MKKKIKWIGILLGSILLLVGGYFLGKQLIWNYKVAHATKIVTLTRKKLPVYEEVHLRTIIDKINGELTTNPKINTEKLGKETVEFKYTTEEGYPVEHQVEVEIVDITPPYIFQSKGKTIYTDYDGDLEKELFCGDNYDQNPECTIEGEYDVHTPGEYPVTFVGKDSSGNESRNDFILTVKPKEDRKTSSGGTTYYTDFQEVKEKYQQENTKFGIDVSHWQGNINFERVKAAGVEFVYIRVGRGDGIGADYVLDDKFEQNIKGFNEVGIPVGVYFYSNANSKEDAIKEANWIVKKIKKYKVDLEIVYDWENWGDFQEYDLSFHDLQESAKSFTKTLKKAGYQGMVYSSKSYLESIWHEMGMPTWLAHYTEQTNYSGKYKVWQLCDDGKVDGINGYVDLDIMYE